MPSPQPLHPSAALAGDPYCSNPHCTSPPVARKAARAGWAWVIIEAMLRAGLCVVRGFGLGAGLSALARYAGPHDR